MLLLCAFLRFCSANTANTLANVRRLQDAIELEADPAEKADLQELLDKDELAVVAAYAAYETARAQLRP